MPRCLGASGSVRTRQNIRSACCAPDVQIFWPFTTNSSPTISARVRSDARSEPEPGSEYPWHQISSAASIFGRYWRRCSSVPCAMSVGPTIWMPIIPMMPGARARTISSFTMVCRMTSAP